MSDGFKNILIIKPSSLGDIVMALPVLSALRKSFPDAKITWLIRPEFAPLLENHPHLTETIIFDRNLLAKFWYNPCAFISCLSLIRRLRDKKFDAVIDLQGLFRTAFLGRLSGCRNRFGMTAAREFAGIFYTHKVPQDSSCVHVVDYYLKVVRAAGAQKTDVQFVFPQDSSAAESVNKLLAGYNVKLDNYAVLIPGSVHTEKCWPVERFTALANKISSQFGLDIVAVGTKNESPIIQKIKSLANVPITDFAGRTNLKELTALLKNARLVVSNDTGPGHIAAALGTPLVMMFSRSNPARIYPYGRKHCAIAVDPDTRGSRINSYDLKHNIENITVDDVYHKVCEQLSQTL